VSICAPKALPERRHSTSNRTPFSPESIAFPGSQFPKSHFGSGWAPQEPSGKPMGEAAYLRPWLRGPEPSDPGSDRDALRHLSQSKPERVCVGPAVCTARPFPVQEALPTECAVVTIKSSGPAPAMLWSSTSSGRKYRASGDRCQLLLALDRSAKAIDKGIALAITRPSRTRSPFKAPWDKRFLASSRRTRRAGRDEAKASFLVP